MGQKVSPISLRLGINRTWDSRWFADKDVFSKLLKQDMDIRKYLKGQLKQAAVSKILIERPHQKCKVTIFSARPGVVIGKKGSDIGRLQKEVYRIVGSDVHLNIREVKKAEIDASLVAQSIAQQLERRVSFRRAAKRSIQGALRMGAEGIKVVVGGRLGGAEIARTESFMEGRVPLHTLRANVDYGSSTAFTAYGCCGVKVWIFKGEIMEHNPFAQEGREAGKIVNT